MKIRIFCITIMLIIGFSGVSFSSYDPTDRVTISYYTDEYGNEWRKECRTSKSGYNHGCRSTVIKKAPKPKKKKVVFPNYHNYKKRRDAQKKEKERQDRIQEAIWKSRQKRSGSGHGCFIDTIKEK